MNLGNLELNVRYKYKNLCEVLEIEQKKSTNSKKAQLKELQQYINVVKEGTWYTVAEIYKKPKEKVDGRGKSDNSHGNNNKFAQYTDILIENFLHKQQNMHHENTIYITNNCLAQEIKMVNFNYRICESNREKFHRFVYVKHPHTPASAERDVFYYIHSKIRPAILGGLNRLQEQNKLRFELTYLIYKDNEITKMDDVDIDFVKETEESLLKEMNITKQQVMLKHETKVKFYNELNDKVMDYFSMHYEDDIDGFFQGYRIVIKNVQEQKDAKKLEKELNEKFIEDVAKSIEKAKDKIREKYKHWIGEPFYDSKWEKEKMGLQYEVGYKFVIKVLLSYKTINIVNDIQEIKTFKQLKEENIKEAEEWEKLF